MRPKIFSLISAYIYMFVFACITNSYAEEKLSRLSPGSVKVSGEIGRRFDITINNNLLKIDADNDFLKPFIERKSKEGYIGLGKFIDSIVHFAANSDDPKVLKLKKQVIDTIISTQEPDGYIGLMVPESRMWKLWDIHEMSYLVLGLANDYAIFGNKESLEASKKLADYMLKHWSAEPNRIPEGAGGLTFFLTTISFENSFIQLYKLTGDKKYLDFVTNQRKLGDWKTGIVRGRHGAVEGHAYAYMARCLAQLELYGITSDPALFRNSDLVMDFLTRNDGLLITGSTGYMECWQDAQLGYFKAGETCATAYLIRLMDKRLRLEENPQYGDIMERAIYNALFAAQSPDGRLLRYYSPFEGQRAFFNRDTYCCPNNFRRIIAELPELIYYRSGKDVTVNLYTASTAKIKLVNGVTLALTQETDYPNDGKITLKVNPSSKSQFTVKLRIPMWCDKPEIKVNGNSLPGKVLKGSFATVNREWSPGDVIEINLPMEWRAVSGRKAQSGKAAVMRGPVLLTLNPALNPKAAKFDPKTLRLDISSLSGPMNDNTIRPDGIACKAKMWSPEFYEVGGPDVDVILTEFPDPDGISSYFLVPNPTDKRLTNDELAK